MTITNRCQFDQTGDLNLSPRAPLLCRQNGEAVTGLKCFLANHKLKYTDKTESTGTP